MSGYCRKLYLIHRRDRFRGEERLVRALREKDNVTMVMESQIIRLNGKDRLESITVKTDAQGGQASWL